MEEQRKIDPYSLVWKASVWYLVAFCHKRCDFRTFRVDRIRDVQLLNSDFVPKEGFDADKYWKKTVEGYSGKKGGYPIRIKIDGKMANIVRRYIWEGEEVALSDDGSIIWQMEAEKIEYAVAFSLSLGKYAQVLEPEELRQKVIDEAEKIISRYKN